MYATPAEWGPAKHDPSHPASAQSLQSSLDRRDSGGLRPDDN